MDDLYSARCSVCGTELMLIASKNALRYQMYCPDFPCWLYPINSGRRFEDPTFGSYIATLVEATGVSAVEISRTFGRSPTWASGVAARQLERWRDSSEM